MPSNWIARDAQWVCRRDRIATAPDGDGLAVCVLDSATVYRLSEFGALVWEQLDVEPVRITELASLLLPWTKIDEADLMTTLLQVLEQLASSALIRLG